MSEATDRINDLCNRIENMRQDMYVLSARLGALEHGLCDVRDSCSRLSRRIDKIEDALSSSKENPA